MIPSIKNPFKHSMRSDRLLNNSRRQDGMGRVHVPCMGACVCVGDVGFEYGSLYDTFQSNKVRSGLPMQALYVFTDS